MTTTTAHTNILTTSPEQQDDLGRMIWDERRRVATHRYVGGMTYTLRATKVRKGDFIVTTTGRMQVANISTADGVTTVILADGVHTVPATYGVLIEY